MPCAPPVSRSGSTRVSSGVVTSGIRRSGARSEDARRASQEVLKLDPSSGLTHAILGDIAIEYDWDWDAGDREFGKALALSPNDANVLIFRTSQ